MGCSDLDLKLVSTVWKQGIKTRNQDTRPGKNSSLQILPSVVYCKLSISIDRALSRLNVLIVSDSSPNSHRDTRDEIFNEFHNIDAFTNYYNNRQT